MSRDRRANPALRRLGVLILFGVTFGFVESAVVYYLRFLLNFHTQVPVGKYRILLNLGFITFVSPERSIMIGRNLTAVEIIREACTIVMLASVALLAASSWRQRLAAFMVAFACWDITYYLYLKILDNWPSSLFTRDVFFLIPVTWIGPVLTPLVICTTMLVLGVRWYLAPPRVRRPLDASE